MNKYLIVINLRTIIVVLISYLATKLVHYFGLSLNLDLTLLSIAILFPLVFTIRGSFRRREKALEFLSEFKTGLSLCLYSIDRSEKTPEEIKQKFRDIIYIISDNLIGYINGKNIAMKEVQDRIHSINSFLVDHKESISGNAKTRIVRYMKEVNEGAINTMAIKNHRTPISLRAYCLVFIYIFPFIHAASIMARINSNEHFIWVVYLVNCVLVFVLVSLYNIQENLEDPFDMKGLDDIKINEFRINS